MQELTQKEVNIYMDLPIKIRQYLLREINGLIWTKSKYGLGYTLEQVPSYTVRDGGVKWTTMSDPIYGTNSIGGGYGLVSSGSSINTTSTLRGHNTHMVHLDETSHFEQPLTFGIPFNPDDIIDSLASFADEFLSFNYEETMSEDEDEIEHTSFEFHPIDNGFGCSLTLDGEYVITVEATTARELALELLSQSVNYFLESCMPSITELKGVKNIFKNDEDNNCILFSSQGIHTSLNRMVSSTRYDLFYRPHTVSPPVKNDMRSYGVIDFVEGKFFILGEVDYRQVMDLGSIDPNMFTTGMSQSQYQITGVGTNNAIGTGTNPLDAWGSAIVGNNTCSDLVLPLIAENDSMADVFKDAYGQGIIDNQTLRNFLNLDDSTK